MNERLQTLKLLTPIRGLAAAGVAIGHAFQTFIAPLAPALALYAGLLSQVSVMLFFVISGYSIAYSAERALAGQNPARVYWVNRLARIAPPLLFSFALMFCLSRLAPFVFASGTSQFAEQEGLVRSGLNFNFANDLGALFFLNGLVTETPNMNGPLWSLAYEVWLYTIYFLTVFIIHTKRHVWLLVPAGLFVLLTHFEVYNLFLKYALVWFAGAATYLFHDRLQLNAAAVRRTGYALLLAAVYFAYRYIHKDGRSGIENFNMASGLSFCSLAVSMSDWPFFARLSESRFARALTESSYTLYLIHFPIFLFLYGIFQPWIGMDMSRAFIAGIASLAAAIAAAMPLAAFLENKPFFARRINLILDRRLPA